MKDIVRDSNKIQGMKRAVVKNNLVNTNHATVLRRGEDELLEVINEAIKKDQEERTIQANDRGEQQGSCFTKALKGSKLFLQAHGYIDEPEPVKVLKKNK